MPQQDPTPPADWADDSPEVDDSPRPQVPEALMNLARKGMQFKRVPIHSSWGSDEEGPKLVKNQLVYFTVDTICTSQDILEAFDKAGIDVD